MSQALKILANQISKIRFSQNLSYEQINQLIAKLDTNQRQKITKTIITTKSINKRSNIDNYILMKACQIFQYFKDVILNKGEKPLMQVCKHLNYSKYQRSTYVFKTGENSDKIYIVINGTVVVHVLYMQKTLDENGDIKVEQKIKQATKFSRGMIFGETSLKQNTKRAISTFAQTDCEFFQIKKKDFQMINKYVISSAMRQKYIYFQNIELFSKLSKPNLQGLIYLTQLRQFNINNIIYRQGDQINYVYIVKSGSLRLEKVIKANQDEKISDELQFKKNIYKKVETIILGQKQVLGDIQIFNNKNRQQTCICITQTAELYKIKKKDFILKVFEQKNNDETGIVDYITLKQHFRFKRIDQLRNSYYNNKLLTKFNKTMSKTTNTYNLKDMSVSNVSHINYNILNRVCNRQYDQQVQKKKRTFLFQQKKKNFRSQKNNPKQYLEQNKIVPFSYKLVNDIVKQKKKYSSLRPSDNSPVFKFMQMPRYFQVKMNLHLGSKSKDNRKLKSQASQNLKNSRLRAQSDYKISTQNLETKIKLSKSRHMTSMLQSSPPQQMIWQKYFEV